jgi:hypothetical protein
MRLATLLAGLDSIVVPAIFDVEVTSALVRGAAAIATVHEYLARDLAAREIRGSELSVRLRNPKSLSDPR